MKNLLIIGGGIAGMTLAAEVFNKAKYNITILESGGINNSRNQELNKEETKNISKPNKNLNLNDKEYEYSSSLGWLSNLDRLRFRGIGGSAKYWGSESQLFLDRDLKRDYDNHGKWPLKFKELDKYYDKAIKLFGFQRKYLSTDKIYKSFNEIYWSKNQDSQKILKKLYSFLKNKIKIITNATCLEIIFKNNQAVSVKVDIKGKLEFINFDIIIISCGAIETTRLLMNSSTLKRNMDLKNYDNLGKFFLDHPHGYVGRINNPSKSFFRKFVKQNIDIKNNIYYKGLRLNQFNHNNNDLLGISFQFREELKYNNLMKNIRNIYICYKNRSYLNIIFEFLNILKNILLFRYFFNNKVVRIWAVAEQDPIEKSQIKKFKSLDILGSNKINVNWLMSNRLLNTMNFALPKLKDLLLELGCKNIDFKKIGNDRLAGLNGGAHHFGTTRMSSNNKKSFVDKNQKIIGINNCFINSTSVFPTNGTANSGLTLIALAMRLASHLNKFKY